MANSTQKRDKFIELAKSRVNRAINKDAPKSLHYDDGKSL